jgi:phage-related holin
MEDIIGFEQQIGVPFKKVFSKAIKAPMQAAIMKAKAPMQAAIIKAKAPMQAATIKAKANLVNQLNQRNIAIAKNISKGLPIPTNIKNAIVKNAKAGIPIPNVIKQGLTIAKQKKSIVPIALPQRLNMQKAVTVAKQNLTVPISTPKQITEAANIVAQQKEVMQEAAQTQMMQKAKNIAVQNVRIPFKALTKVNNRTLVNEATPIQKSFMPVDLPYKNFAPKTAPLKIPATNFTLPTDIDLVEPSVDAGVANYYGK